MNRIYSEQFPLGLSSSCTRVLGSFLKYVADQQRLADFRIVPSSRKRADDTGPSSYAKASGNAGPPTQETDNRCWYSSPEEMCKYSPLIFTPLRIIANVTACSDFFHGETSQYLTCQLILTSCSSIKGTIYIDPAVCNDSSSNILELI